MSKSETTTHCLVFASIGASAVATNFFTNFETPLALGSAALAAGLFVFGFASLLVNNKNLKEHKKNFILKTSFFVILVFFVAIAFLFMRFFNFSL